MVMALEEPGKKILPGGKEELGAELSVVVAVADPLEILAPLEVEGLGGGDGIEVDRVGVRRQRAGIRLGDVEERPAAQAADQEGPLADVEPLQRLELELGVVE